MTVTREPSDRARTDARRAAQAARIARRARTGSEATDAAEVEPDVLDGAAAVEVERPNPPTSLTKAIPAAPDEEVEADADSGAEAEAEAEAEPQTAAAEAGTAKAAKTASTRTASAKTASAKTVSTKTASTKTASTKTASTKSASTKTASTKTASAKVADDDTEDDERVAGVRRRPGRPTLLASAFALLAAVFLVISAVVHANAQDTRSTSPAAARDAALLAARQDIVVLNTLDYRDIDGGLKRWADATTGTLRDQLTSIPDADKQVLAVGKTVTTASVLAAAVTQVDATRGAATVIAVVQLVVKPVTGESTTKRNRYNLTMAKVGDVWKISAAQQVQVTVT